jgi:hypothetical protein
LWIDAQPVPGDAWSALGGGDLGLLGIEFATRRRNCLNARVARDRSGALSARWTRPATARSTSASASGAWRTRRRVPARGRRLTPGQRAWIAGADTLFIASGYRGQGEGPAFGMDASHRGGSRVSCAWTATRPVFPTTRATTTSTPSGTFWTRARTVFVDFDGSLLHDWPNQHRLGSDAVLRRASLVIFDVEKSSSPAALPLRWDASAEPVRSLRLIEKVRESDDVTSFVFEARDGGPLPDFEAGQHLPIPRCLAGAPVAVLLPGCSGCGPLPDQREARPHGTASRHLHDRVEPGAILHAPARRRPVLDCSDCPSCW